MKKFLALDIDGTITAHSDTLTENVRKYFESLYEMGWNFVFVTGRPFFWARRPLESLSFPYTLAVQNGASIVDMPSKKVIKTKSLEKSCIPILEELFKQESNSFVLYTGVENNDVCYYCKDKFPRQIQEYIVKRLNVSKEPWKAVDSLELIDFTSFKFFGAYDKLSIFSSSLEKKLNLHIPLIKDTIDPEITVAQATLKEVNKGAVVDWIKSQNQAFVVAAGNDLNDLSLLNQADFKIAMQEAPQELKNVADIVAASVLEEGIIEALTSAIKQFSTISSTH